MPHTSYDLRHAFTEYFFTLVFIIVHTRSKMQLLGANNLLMPFKSNKFTGYPIRELIHSRLTKTKSIGTGQDPKSQAGRQSDGYVVWCLELSRGGRIGEKMNRDRIC